MGRRKGQTVDSSLLGWATPDNVAPGALRKYLCDLGPRYCPICHSKCAFGVRYIENRRKENKRVAAHVAALRRNAN